ncbi:hypothetical protein Tco_0706568 [Tanacetum coccineum]|uniref:Uncharacterized protein n=1 Tax=Tanacetum coccineum TaxID=301880 RepID=A0ABQ4Y8Q2_9ASTR
MICLPSSSVCFHQLTIPSSIVSKPYLILLLLSQLLGVVKWSLSYSFHSCGPFAVIPKKVTDTSFIRIDCILLSCQFMSFSSMSKSQFVPDSQYVPWDYMVINKDTLRLSFPFQQLVFLMTAVTGGGSIRIIHPFPVDNSLSWSFHSDYLSKHQLSIVLSSMCLHASSWFDDFIILLRCCEISSFAASMLLFDISSSLCRRFFYTPGIPFRGRLYKAVVKGHYPLETGFACALIAKDHITLKDFLKLRQGDRLGSCQCKRSCCYRFKLEQIGGSWAYTHEEGIDVDEVFAPVPRIRSYQVIGTPHGFVDPGSHLRRFIGWSMLCYGLHQVLELVPNLDRKEILYSDVVDFLVKGLIHGMQVKEREETGTIVIFGNMKRGFRRAPRPLLPAMLLVATTNPSAGEKDLKQTKLTMGSAIVKLVKKVKKLEGILKRRNVVLSDSEEEEPEAQGRKSQDDPLVSLVQGLPKSIDKGRRYKRRKETKGKKVVTSLDFQEEVSTGYAEGVNTGSIKVSTVSGQEKLVLLSYQIGYFGGKKEERSLKQVHSDSFLAQRLAEEEELNEQQKHRRFQGHGSSSQLKNLSAIAEGHNQWMNLMKLYRGLSVIDMVMNGPEDELLRRLTLENISRNMFEDAP